jgi:hypothetical protein
MPDKILFFLRKNIFALFMLVWLFLCFAPWTVWLESLPWIRLGISIIIFIVPGVTISLFLAGKKLSLSNHFTSGLAFSLFLVGILGVFGRVFHLPFAFIKPVFALTGLIGLLILGKYSRSEQQLYKQQSFSIITLVLLVFMMIFGILVMYQTRFQGDHFSYLAYLTNWQHAQPLNFKEVIFGTGTLDSVRFWLAMFPMNLAFLAEISNLHGLLLFGFYLGPFLMVTVILASYNLYEDLLQSQRQAIVALLLQFTFLFLLARGLEPGGAFFYRLFEDKAFAAFVLAPVFFIALRHFLESFTPRSGIFFLLSGLSLALTHPVILAYGIFIAGVYTIIVKIAVRDYKKIVVTMVLMAFTILPLASLRFVPQAKNIAFDFKTIAARFGPSNGGRISGIEGTPFYGFDVHILQIQPSKSIQENPLQYLLSWSYLWILGIGFLWSLFNLKRNVTAPFIAATSLLVLLCAIPYTGWLVGYPVSPRMLWRAPWLLPIGLIGCVLLIELLKFISGKVSANTRSKISGEWVILSLVSVVCFFMIGYFSVNVYSNRWPALTKLDNYRNNLANLSALGNYLENNIEKPSIFVAPTGLSDYLPGLSSKSKVVLFRGPQFTPYSVNRSKLSLIFSQDTSITIKQRMANLEKYHIQYILVQDDALKDYYAGNSQFFNVQKAGDFWIIKFQKISP